MKKIVRVISVLAMLGMSSLSLAEGSSKIAVFDVQEAIMNTNAAKEEMKAFEARSDVAKMIKDAEKLKKEIIALRDEAAKDSSKWSAEKVQEQKKAIEFKQADFELIARKLNSERQAAGKKLIDDLAPKLESIVKGIIESEGIALLLDKRSAIHADPGLDITASVTEKLNAGAGKK